MQVKEKLEKKDIKKLFTSGFKQRTEFSAGIEYERLPITSSFQTASYYGENGVCNFLRSFAKDENWDYITDDYNIIGLKQGHDTITLEPGCQIELSVKPEKTIFELESKINLLNKKMDLSLKKSDIKLLNYGVSPLTTHKNINLIPKRRYEIMAKYLWGILSDVMMRETAGIQGCFDFEDEEDAVRKFKISNKLSPFMTAMFANSPIRGGVETGYKTFRGLSWLNTDNDRCGFACDIDKEFSFDEYINRVLKSPIIFLNKNDIPIAVNGKITFERYMKDGWEGFDADIEDFKLHANLYFPEVRLRNFIEIRNHDCWKYPYAVIAIYKGILYNKKAMDEIEELLKEFSQSDYTELRYNVPKSAQQTRIKNYVTGDISKEIVKIAENSLLEMKTGEEKYLEPIKELVMRNLSPADVIIRNWNGLWNKDIQKLIRYISE